MRNMNRTMQEAMQLMQTGDLQAATRAITRGLARETPVPANDGRDDCIVAAYEVVDDPADAVAIDARDPDGGAKAAREAGFTAHRFSCEAGTLAYKLFVPTGLDADAVPPLVVMLHGCTQSPDDFARGTRMNALAQQAGYVVAYPAQSAKNNPGKCWNWFRSGDQQRGRGEAALLAALTSHLVATHRLDEHRVYVAGLSAGGAMAAVLGHAYPDIFAAIGVHSGLPHQAAHDLPSALAAMRQGTVARDTPATPAVVPVIVFHGDRDTTVDPCNGAAVLAQSIGAKPGDGGATPAPLATIVRGSTPSGRAFTQTIYTGADGTVVAEQWVVHDAGHAWFGGDAAGSYTDPAGPDASAQMLRFFSSHRRVTAA